MAPWLTSGTRLFSLRRKDSLKKANITHVVSALRLPLDRDLFTNFKHHVVEVDDVEDENIIEHFAGSNAFIQEGLDGGGGVLVHWWVHNFSFLRHFWQAWSHQTGKSKEWKDTTFLSSTTLPLSRCNMCWFFRPLRIQHCYGTVLSPLLRSLPYFHQALALRCRNFDAATSVLFLPDYGGTKGLGGRYA